MSEMVQYVSLSDVSSDNLPSIICLGNFDGVHKGHCTLIDRARQISFNLSLLGQKVRTGILCFDELSSNHFGKATTPNIMSLEKKIKFFQDDGLDFAYICCFSKIKDLSPIDFIEKVLVTRCNCIGVVCGFNFRFGKNAAGNAEYLTDYFNSRSMVGKTSDVVSSVMLDGEVISSSRIRELISLGKIEAANSMLGHEFSITHTVVHGKHLGTRLGFPTLNHMLTEQEIIPAFGIYATKTVINGESFFSVTNVGVRPTVSQSNTVTCETHVIGIDDNTRSFYGQSAEIFFYSKLRDEKRFASPDELSAAIAADVEASKNYFKNKEV